MQRLRLPFDVAAPNIDETPNTGETPEKLCFRLAQEKAEKIANELSTGLIIASDQVLECNNQFLGKPGNYENAFKQLKIVEGKTVTFYTSICLFNVESKHIQLDAEKIQVSFKALSDAEIERYLKLDEPYDCAGSFRSESLGITLVDSIQCDDPNALIGLPLIKLTAMLRNEGVQLP